MKDLVIALCGVGGQPLEQWGKGLALALEARGYAASLEGEVSKQGGASLLTVRAGEVCRFSPIQPGEADCLIALEPLEGARNILLLKPGGVFLWQEIPINPAPVSAGRVAYPDLTGLEGLGISALPLPSSPEKAVEQLLAL